MSKDKNILLIDDSELDKDIYSLEEDIEKSENPMILSSSDKTCFNKEDLICNKEGRLRLCFENAREKYQQLKGEGKNVKYYLGTVMFKNNKKPIDHAWVVLDNDKLIETTPFLKLEDTRDTNLIPQDDLILASKLEDIIYIGEPLPEANLEELNNNLKFFPNVGDEFWNSIREKGNDQRNTDIKKGGMPIGTIRKYTDGSTWKKVTDVGKDDWKKLTIQPNTTPLASTPQQQTDGDKIVDSIHHIINSDLLDEDKLLKLKDDMLIHKTYHNLQKLSALNLKEIEKAITNELNRKLQEKIKNMYDSDGFPKDNKSFSLFKQTNIGGSTGAVLLEGPDGKKFVLKKGANAEHIQSEIIANKMFKILGVPVPLFKEVGGFLVSEYVPNSDGLNDKTFMSTVGNQVRDTFVANALLANWDVVENDNIRVDSTGLIYQVDSGGSLLFTARGELKHKRGNGSGFSKIIGELDSMRTNTSSQKSWFGNITPTQIISQIDKILPKKKSIIDLVENSKMDDSTKQNLKSRLESRFDNLLLKKDELENELKNKNHAISLNVNGDLDSLITTISSEKEFDLVELRALTTSISDSEKLHNSKTEPNSGFIDVNHICKKRGFDKLPVILKDADFQKAWQTGKYDLSYRTVSKRVQNSYRESKFLYTGGIGNASAYGAGIYAAQEGSLKGKVGVALPPPPKTSDFTDSRNYNSSGVTHYVLFPKSFRWGDFSKLNQEYKALINGTGSSNPKKVKLRNDIINKRQEQSDCADKIKTIIEKKNGFSRIIDEHLDKWLDSEASIISLITILNKEGNGAKGGRIGNTVTLQFPNKGDGSLGDVFTYNIQGVKGSPYYGNIVSNLYQTMRSNYITPTIQEVSNAIASDKPYQNIISEINTLSLAYNKEPNYIQSLSPEDAEIKNILKNHKASEKVGLYAVLKGYDGLRGSGMSNYITIFNRAKTIIKESDYE